jgi:hypothetical protein
MTEKDVYLFYNDKVKILYSEIEARNNTLPVELLFEIHAAFDHLKRIHVDNEPETLCAEKAFSHLKRGLLDTFKLKLKYHNDDYTKLIKSKTDLRFIDNGKFLPSLLSKRKVIIGIAKEARLLEGKKILIMLLKNGMKSLALLINLKKNSLIPQNYSGQEKLIFFTRLGHLSLVL